MDLFNVQIVKGYKLSDHHMIQHTSKYLVNRNFLVVFTWWPFLSMSDSRTTAVQKDGTILWWMRILC